MIASYLPPDATRRLKSTITTSQELDALLAHAARLKGGRGVPAVELIADDGSTLMIGQVEQGAVLMWGDRLGETQHSVGPAGAEGLVVFDYFGSFTEVPAECVVSMELAREAALQFLDAGYPLVEGLTMEPD
jgi:hypothetical protein